MANDADDHGERRWLWGLQGGRWQRQMQRQRQREGSKDMGGGKALGKGLGSNDNLAWKNPQPANPCQRCGSKDHYKNQCPHRNALCGVCNKYGHLSSHCNKGGGQQPCACCGKENHTTANCNHKTKVCSMCNVAGHLAIVCPSATTAGQKHQAGGSPAPQGLEATNQEWWCTKCCVVKLQKCCTK